MNIGIDITSLLHHRGVSRYTKNLVGALAVRPDAQLALYGYSLRKRSELKKSADQLLAGLGQKHRSVIKPYPQSVVSLLWSLGLFAVDTQLPNLDIFHSWDWLQPPDKSIPIVSTIHDLAILKFPETAHPKIVEMHKRSWKMLLANQSHVIAVSHATKKDIIELLGYPSYLVHVVHEALPLEVRNINLALTEDKYNAIVSSLQLNRPYILFVGTREPRKNLARLIEAWQPLANDYELVIAGAEGWDTTSSDAYQNNKNLRFMGKVTDTQLSVLYAQAELFVYPSLEEGFGLPILEAFHHGTPVVTSNIGGTLEVAGNAAALVDPTSVEEIREAMKAVLSEDIDAQRKRLQRMVVRQQMFSWEKVAEETMSVYRKTVEDFNEK